MRTLDYWESRLTPLPSTIECPKMYLNGRDHEPPIFVGPGRIDIRSSTVIDFMMYATPTDGLDAVRRLVRARENPYEIRDQFRLVATDYEGTEWACGWTLPEPKADDGGGWLLTGKLTSLVTAADGPFVSRECGVELVFQPRLDLPMGKLMTSIVSLDDEEIARRHSPGRHTIQLLDSEINFFHKPFGDSLWVTAKTSAKLTHPHLENWIAEPFRILFGQLIFPRLIARNLGDGRAHISLRRSPCLFANPGVAALLRESPRRGPVEFWELYANLLELIAEARDDQGQPNFQSHPITRFYEEIAQATQGSRWVLCMTLASAGEGLTRMLMPATERESEFPAGDVGSLTSIIEGWKGNPELKKRILGWFAFLGSRSTTSYLRGLVKVGVLHESNEDAWSEVRNAVMHGKLVTPWPTEEEDRKILALASLVHLITYELVGEHGGRKEKTPLG